jgi:transcriptional regulator of acetoin/glycerol metabolism
LEKLKKSWIESSWKRCAEKIDKAIPGNRTRRPPEYYESLKQEYRELLAVAPPVMKEALQAVWSLRPVVVLLNPEGVVLEVCGHPKTLAICAQVGLDVGFVWDEDCAGTSAGNLALSTGLPFMTVGPDHYCTVFQNFTCACSPIYNESGHIIGAVDISLPYPTVSYRLLDTAIKAAFLIEQKLVEYRHKVFVAKYQSILDTVLESHPDPVLVVGTDGHPIAANTKGKELDNRLSSETCIDKRLPVSYRSGSTAPARREVPVTCKGNVVAKVIIGTNSLKAALTRLAPVDHGTFEAIYGRHPRLQKAVEVARRAAPLDLPVLIVGETGTGKELFARAIHFASRRSRGPFVAVNCAAIPRTLLESELFGYVEGAFTGARRGGSPGKFEIASGGTLFLDEIGDMPLDAQGALLRALEEKVITRLGARSPTPVDVRIIAATNKDLNAEVQAGRFRKDLLYRLRVVVIELPPLRERMEDLKLLVPALLQDIASRIGRGPFTVDERVFEILHRYAWPGNVRELRACLEHAAAVSEGNRITPEDLPSYISSAAESLPVPLDASTTSVINAMKETGGNVAQAARLLGISRSTIYRRLRRMVSDMPSSPKA